MKVRNVKVNSLASVFTDSTLSTFTQNAIEKGVTNDSIIYIVCGANDTTYGSLYTLGSHWIWAKGEMFCGDIPPEAVDISGKEDKSNKVTSLSDSSTNTQYPSAKAVWDEFDDVVISDEISSVGNISLEVTSRIPIVDKTSDSSSSFAIDPNKMYMFGTRTSLTITLNAGTSGIVNEYMFQFISGSTATTLNVPNTVVWLKDPDILTGKKYAVSIENNLGIIGEWDNE